jgi:hypothetical protein
MVARAIQYTTCPSSTALIRVNQGMGKIPSNLRFTLIHNFIRSHVYMIPFVSVLVGCFTLIHNFIRSHVYMIPFVSVLVELE